MIKSQSFLLFALTKNFPWAECPFNPGEIEVESFSLNSAVTFTALKQGCLKFFLILNLA